MDNEFLNFLKENPKVFYIYNRGSVVYKLNTNESDVDFLVVVKNDFQLPKQYKKYKYPHHRKRQITFNVMYNNYDFIFFTVDEWFDMVMNNHMYAWECACLNRKFIHKEHVKLLLTTDLIKLRNGFDKTYKTNKTIAQKIQNRNPDKFKKILWETIKNAIFTLQIIENHKIINYTAANNYINVDSFELFEEKINIFYDKIKKYTDGIIELNKQKKYGNI